MSDATILADVLFRQPANCIVYAMLKDELMGTHDMNPTEAARHLAAVVVSGATAAQLRRAAALLSSSSTLRDVLLWDICAECGFINLDDLTVCVVAGDRLPRLTVRAGTARCGYWPTRTVLVGASWLLATADRYSR